MFASGFNSGLESDSYLSMYSKLYATKEWDREGLSDKEVAAVEVNSLIWWTYAEMAFENYRAGLATEDAWREMEVEIQALAVWPVNLAVYDYWYSQAPSEFTPKIDERIKSSRPAAKN